MRIRRRDKDNTEKASAPKEPVPYDQELPARPESAPTSTDPVISLGTDVAAAPPPTSAEGEPAARRPRPRTRVPRRQPG